MPSARHRCFIPPSPEVFRSLFARYEASGVADKITFPEFLNVIGFRDPSATQNGMDDGFLLRGGPAGIELFSIPSFKVTGGLEIVVLLVDFPDLPGTRSPAEYQSLLFEKNRAPSGSLRDYYFEVSQGQVEISGSVHGWMRLPKPSTYYTNGSSGMDASTYPLNAQGMAEDAVKQALSSGVAFPKTLDKLDQGIVTALFIVHAGPGAEVQTSGRGNFIWSHKWTFRQPVPLPSGLLASIYLTVPENCQLGVCAHELGHLAFQWEDFYDANYDKDGNYWDGSGNWDLMASGCYNGDSQVPAYPVGLHRLQHGWIEGATLTRDGGAKQQVELPRNKIIKVKTAAYAAGQYLLLENRQQVGFDQKLPGHGLLVWRVDESKVNTTSTAPGLFLVEAGSGVLLDPGDYNQGDPGDPFPGQDGVTSIGETGTESTSFSGVNRSGVTIDSIEETPTGSIKFQVTFD